MGIQTKADTIGAEMNERAQSQPWKFVETGEPDVRLRVNFMNQLVVQVRYPMRRVPSASDAAAYGEALGRAATVLSEWRDALSTDPREVAKVVGILNGVGQVAT